MPACDPGGAGSAVSSVSVVIVSAISTGGPLLAIELVAVLAMAGGIWLASGARAERGSFEHVDG